ncbi:RNA-directed DNA polymerase, eukaryota, reverse transcriptase zinc-binding domain protein [Tanacetum coccineum]
MLPMIISIRIPHMLHLEGKLFKSLGCLVLVRRDCIGSSKFTIYQMRKGCSVWSSKYIVNTDDFMNPLPEGWSIRSIVWSIVLGEREEDSFIIIDLSAKVVQYNLISKTLREIYDMGSNEIADDCLHGFIPPYAMHAFDYVYNPSTNLLKILSEPDYANVDSNLYGCAGLRLAFHPTKSPYYKVVNYFNRVVVYFLVVEDDFVSSKFTIYEMMKGSSVWSVRYHVDTDDFMTPLPEGWLIRPTVWSIVLVEMEDDSFLVINLSRKVVEYNLISKNLWEMYDMRSYQLTDDYHDGFIPPFAMYDMHYQQVEFHEGLRINMSKSKIMGVHVENAYVNQAASKLGCLVLNNPFSFLGTKVGEAMSRIQAWKEVVEKVKSRLSKWKMKTLSIGGRLTLLKSVLGSIPIFHMSIFRVPSRVLHVLESIRCHFFNGHEMGSNKGTWVKWNYVLTDKKHGGLGVSSLYALNRGLMIKWGWRFFTQKESLWAKVITAIHGDYDKVESRGHAVGRSCWLSIVNEVRILKNKGMKIFDFMNLKLGNGDTSRFWTDRWYAGGIIKDLCPCLFALDNCKEIFLDSLAEVVRSINLVSSADRWIWNLESSGEFSVASARKKIDVIRFPIVKDATRWVKCVPIKVNILAWKIRNDALPTRFNISRRGIDIQSISCPICENGVESSEHLFFKCYLIREIGCKIASWWNINYVEVNSYEEWKTWLISCRMESKLKQMFEGVWYSLWWHIWSYRNKILFDDNSPMKAFIFDNVVSSSFYWCKFRCKASFG